MFSITPIGPESDALLRNLLQHYIHDMSEWFEIDTEPDGSYAYDTASIWQHGYEVYLAKVGDSIAGFAIVGSASKWLNDPNSHDIHEFFILRRYRKQGIGKQMATQLWNRHPGQWQVRVLEANKPALNFWRKAIFSPYKEETRQSNQRPWKFLTFNSDARRYA